MKKKQNGTPKKDPQKTALLKSMIGSLILIALGVLLLLKPDFATNTVASVIGWLFIAGGAIFIAITILNWEVMGLTELIIGIVATALGIFIVIKPEFLASAFGAIIGIFLGILSIVNLSLSVRQKKAGKVYIPTLVLGFVLLALALVLILVPMSLYRFLFRVVGVLMILGGLVGLVLRSKLFMNMKRAPKDPTIVDARED